jgi:hypothetical protein
VEPGNSSECHSTQSFGTVPSFDVSIHDIISDVGVSYLHSSTINPLHGHKGSQCVVSNNLRIKNGTRVEVS